MPDDIIKSKSLSELVRMLAETRVNGLMSPAVPQNALLGFLQPPAVVPPSLVAPILPQASLIPPPSPAPKDLKSPLTKKWNPGFHRMIKIRLKMVTRENAKRIRNITKGLTMPEITSVAIGSAKKMEAAILFFDLQDFTSVSSRLPNEDVLYLLNTIIPEMMHVVRRWQGEIEKNTGDGLMAIFGTETRNSFLIARDAIECAMTMKYLMLNDIQPKLIIDGLPSMNFRIGIDMGEVLISRIGINNSSFLTVVGDAANRASKLQSLANPNGICIAENMYRNIAPILHQYCAENTHESWGRYFHYEGNWPDPREWLKIKL